MKKLLGISVIAMLAVAPAFADPVAGDPAHIGTGVTASSVTASAEPEFALAQANSETDGNAASAGYVKGAYNAAIKAINKVNSNVATTAGNGINKTNGVISVNAATNGGIDVSASGVAVSAGNGIDVGSGGVAVKAKTDAGIVVDSNGVAVDYDNSTITINTTSKKLEVKSGVFDASGAASTAKSDVETKLQTTTANATDGYDIKAKTLSVGGDTAATLTATQTLTNKTIDGDDNTITDLGFNTLKSDAVVKSTDDSGNGIAATSSASDSKLVTEKAVAAEIDSAITNLGMSNYATKTGVDNTINGLSATVNDGFALTSGAVTGTASVAIMDTWGSDTPATTPLAVTHSLSVGTAITEGTVTINKQTYANANQ